MLMDRVRITLDRKSGEEVAAEKIGTRNIKDSDYYSGCAGLMTGMSLSEIAMEIEREAVK